MPEEQNNIQATGDQMFEHYRFVSDKGQALIRIDKYLAAHMVRTSRSRIQQALDAEYVMVNGKVVKSNYKVKPEDVITINFPYQRHVCVLAPEDIPLDIVYEDEDILLVNKPAGLVVHPGHGHYTGTLLNALMFHLNIQATSAQESISDNEQDSDDSDDSGSSDDGNLGLLVHRIDKDTSGLLVVAKNDQAQIKLAKQFFHHTIERKYVAIVWGNIEEDEGTIVGNIGRDPNDRLRFKVYPEESGIGKHAVTHFRVLERFGYVTMVECRLETGRTHQIRVHMNHIGHPLFNDERYGGSRILKGTIYTKYKQFVDNCFALLPRQALHAQTLGFIHPRTGEEMFFQVPLPSDMQALIDKWRKYAMQRTLEED